MMIAEATFLIGLVGALIYGGVWFLARSQTRSDPPAALSGRWRVGHYDVKGETRIVVQKVPDSGASVLDEHVVATLRTDDPDYDDKFLAAMNTARQRQAVFQAEENG